MQPWRHVPPEPGPGVTAVFACVLLVTASAVQVGSGYVPAIDRHVRWWARAHQDPHVFAVLDTLVRLAHWRWVCLYLIAVACATAFARRTLRPLRQTLLAVVLLVVVTAVLKAILGRPGPTGVAPAAYNGAWPSGHAVTLVVAAVVIVRLFPAMRPERHFRVTLAFLPAVVLSAALVYCGHHWFSDVAVAFPLGLLLGWAALWLERWSGHRDHPLSRTVWGRWSQAPSQRSAERRTTRAWWPIRRSPSSRTPGRGTV